MQPDKIKHLLDNVESGSGKASIIEKTEGMKYLLAVSISCGPPALRLVSARLTNPSHYDVTSCR